VTQQSGSTRISSKTLFPSARSSKGKTHSLCPSPRSILGPRWVKMQSHDWIYHLYPVLPLIVQDAAFSPTAQAAANYFYWHPLIPLWSMCRCLQQSTYIDCGYMGRVFGQMGFFRTVCPARPYPAAPSLGLFDAQSKKRYVSLSAPDLREVQTNLTHCLDPLWKPSFE